LDLSVTIEPIENPRKEAEEHYYNPVHRGLLEMGLEPHFLTEDVLAQMLERIIPYRDKISRARIMPRIRWR
ncbi:MAG: hypothetical protein JO105_23525, partial [Hyphomicrobiales bacterium]|nr:hypothetical protein [Hyphomicrobiales bacterium]